MIHNPFRFGDPVSGQYYLDIPALGATVRQFLQNQIHVVLIGPRRFGKTSFIQNLLAGLEADGWTTLFFDIYNVTSHRDFLQQLLRVMKSKQTWSRKAKDWGGSMAKLRPKLNVDVDALSGDLNVSLAPELAATDIKEAIQDAIASIASLGKKVVVAIDEFQTIAELQDNGWLEATLRTKMQSMPNVAFAFSGSRRRLIHEMINDVKRPFFRSCQPIDFPAFGPEFSTWVVGRLQTVGITCATETVDLLRKLVHNTPNYVQMAGFHLVASGVEHVTEKTVRQVLRTIVKQNAYAYQTILNSLTPVQQRALRLVAIEGEDLYSKANLTRYEIGSGPALASALKALKAKQILEEGVAKGRVYFDDPLFAIWLKAEFSDFENDDATEFDNSRLE